MKAVGESTTDPIKYYDVNVGGSISLLTAMAKAGCNNIVFSSSATVYGKPKYLPYDEEHPTNPVNPYGRTKLMIENIIHDWTKVDLKRKGPFSDISILWEPMSLVKLGKSQLEFQII